MESGWSSALDLFLDLDRADGPGRAIERSLRTAIRAGRLTPGTVLPSSRSLARDLGVARGTVSAAYSQLAAEGYLAIRQGAPTRVSWAPPRRPLPAATAPPPRHRWDLRPGRPDSASFPRLAWARACRHVLAHAPDEVFGYGDARGSAELRQALADYLGRARGVDTSPERLLICDGFTQALTLICTVLRASGATTLAVEDPCAPRYRQLAETLGLRVTGVPCDQDGLRTDHLARSPADAVLVTPAHQFPLGVTMSAARRTALVQWARSHQAVIIEDDYDGEFRYDRQPVGALQQLDRGTSILEQLTLAEMLTTGAFDRHVRRMRASYRHRRDELAQTLQSSLPHLRLAGTTAGLHALIYLPGNGPAEKQLQVQAARHSVALHTLARYWLHPPAPCPQAVIIGYASPASHAYRPALRALTQLLAGNPPD